MNTLVKVTFLHNFKSTKSSMQYFLTWVDCSADDPAERVPRPLVEPVQEVVEAVLEHDNR